MKKLDKHGGIFLFDIKRLNRKSLAVLYALIIVLSIVPVANAAAAPLLWSYATGDYVVSVSVSNDGQYIAAGSLDLGPYDLNLFHVSSSTPLWSYEAYGYFMSTSVSGDGSTIAAAIGDTVYVFDRSSSTPLWSYTAGAVVFSVSVSGDGQYIAAGGMDNNVYLFDRSSSTPLWDWPTADDVNSVSISNDGSTVVAGNNWEKVWVFDRSSGSLLWTYTTEGDVESVSISDDGSTIAAGGWDYTVYLFDRSSSTPLWSYTTGGIVYSVSVSGDGDTIAAGSTDDNVYVFDRSSGTPLWSYPSWTMFGSVSVSYDGNRIAAGCADNRVYLFDRSRNELWNYYTGGDVNSVSVSSDGQYVAAGSNDNNVYLFGPPLSLVTFPLPFILDKAVNTTFIVGGSHPHGPYNWQAWTTDVLGAIGVAGKLGIESDDGTFYQFVDTDVATYDSGTGEVTVDWSMIPSHIISVGGPAVNIFTLAYETFGGIPFHMTGLPGSPALHSDLTGNDYSPDAIDDYAVIAIVYDDSADRYVLLVYGVTGKGSQAACMVLQYYDVSYRAAMLVGQAVIIRWVDMNLNNLVDAYDSVLLVETWGGV